MPETKSRYQLERTDYAEHLTFRVQTKMLDESDPQKNKPRRPLTPGRLKRGDNKSVTFTVYAPTVFATLRAALGLSHDDFLQVIKYRIKT